MCMGIWTAKGANLGWFELLENLHYLIGGEGEVLDAGQSGDGADVGEGPQLIVTHIQTGHRVQLGQSVQVPNLK